jgi:hypothetical protein
MPRRRRSSLRSALGRRYGHATWGLRHAWRVRYRNRDYGYVIAGSRDEALEAAKKSAYAHWTLADVKVVPDLRHAEVRRLHAGGA